MGLYDTYVFAFLSRHVAGSEEGNWGLARPLSPDCQNLVLKNKQNVPRLRGNPLPQAGSSLTLLD